MDTEKEILSIKRWIEEYENKRIDKSQFRPQTVELRSIKNIVKARAYLSAAQANLTDSTWIKIVLNAETYDVGGYYDVTRNYRFDVPEDGYYFIAGCVGFTSVVADKVYGGAIYKNGVAITTTKTHASLIGDVYAPISDVVKLVRDDYIELYGYAGAGVSTVDVIGTSDVTFLTIHRIS